MLIQDVSFLVKCDRIQKTYRAALLPLDASKAVDHSVFVCNVVAKPAPQVMANEGIIQIPRKDIIKTFQDAVDSGK